MKYLKFIFLFWVSSTQALEVTDYKVDRFGMFHQISVAFDNLDKTGYVQCVIYLNDKPIKKEIFYVNGVATVKMFFTNGIKGNTKAGCKEK